MEEKILAKADDLFVAINKFTSKGDNYLLDKAFPNHDGVENTEYLVALYELQQALYSVHCASEIALKHVSDIIEISESK